MTHDLWANLNKRMYAYLDSVTLDALVNRRVQPDADMAVLRNIRRRATLASVREIAAI